MLIALVIVKELPIGILPPILVATRLPVYAVNAQEKPVRRPVLLIVTAALGTAVLAAITLYLIIR